MKKLDILTKMLLIGFFGAFCPLAILSFKVQSFMETLIPYCFAMVFYFQCLFLGNAWSDMETYRQKAKAQGRGWFKYFAEHHKKV